MSWFSRLFKKEEVEAPKPTPYVQFDFIRTFPHVFWSSSMSYDSEAPDGFRYKLFATRHEPEMVLDLLLLREMADGTKKQVFHMQAPLEHFGATDQVIRELESSANVSFTQFDFSGIRTFDEFQSRAIEAGWEAGHCE